MKVVMLVRLKIPDTTAITAGSTLRRLGIKIERLERDEFYEFDVLRDMERFRREIQRVDLLVNANKHSAEVFREEQRPDHDEAWLLVTPKEKDGGLLVTLKESLGFADVVDVRQGTLWKVWAKDAKKAATQAAKLLLASPHYQDVELL